MPTSQQAVPTAQCELITPERAHALLAMMGHNRILNRDRVAMIARDILTGNWRISHQGVAISAENKLMDGQHRLRAIIMAGVPVNMMVTYNVPVDSIGEIDTHQPRTAGQRMTILSGVSVGRKLAIASALLRSTSGGRHGWSYMTNAERDEYTERHEHALAFAEGCIAKTTRMLTTATIGAVYARAYYNVADTQRIREFAKVVAQGIATDPADSAALRFRARVLAGRHDERAVHAMCEAALANFIARKPIERLYAATDELFPLPEERAE